MTSTRESYVKVTLCVPNLLLGVIHYGQEAMGIRVILSLESLSLEMFVTGVAHSSAWRYPTCQYGAELVQPTPFL